MNSTKSKLKVVTVFIADVGAMKYGYEKISLKRDFLTIHTNGKKITIPTQQIKMVIQQEEEQEEQEEQEKQEEHTEREIGFTPRFV